MRKTITFDPKTGIKITEWEIHGPQLPDHESLSCILGFALGIIVTAGFVGIFLAMILS